MKYFKFKLIFLICAVCITNFAFADDNVDRQCLDRKFACFTDVNEKLRRVANGQLCKQDGDTTTCTFIQCDNNGQVKLSPPNPQHFFPRSVDWSFYCGAGYFRSANTHCLGNCCYDFKTGCFKGELMKVPLHNRFLCCPTYEGYINGDCSKSDIACNQNQDSSIPDRPSDAPPNPTGPFEPEGPISPGEFD